MPRFPNIGPVTLSVPRKPTPYVDKRQLETAEEHEAAQSAIELASLRRQADEIFDAAYRQAAEAPDEKAAQSILDKAVQAASALKTENVRVQNAFSEHLEGSLAGQEERFANQANEIRRKNLLDQSEKNYEAAVERGDEVGAATALEHQSTAFPELRAQNLDRISKIPSSIALVGIRSAVAEGDMARARESIEKARKLPLLVEQKEDIAKLEDVVERAERDGSVQIQVELLTAADKASDLGPVERHTEIERIKSALVPTYKSAEEARATINWLDAIDKGEPFQVDPQAEIEADDIIRRLDADSTPQERTKAREEIVKLAPKLGPRTYDFIKELGTRLDAEKTKAVEYATDDAVARNLISKEYAPVFRRAIERWVNEQKGPVDLKNILAYAAGMAVLVPPTGRPRGEEPPVKLATVLGVLQTGKRAKGLLGEFIKLNNRMEAIEYVVQEIWYDERLRDQDRTELRKMLDAKYPGDETLPLLPGETTEAARIAAKAAEQQLAEPSRISTKVEHDALPMGAHYFWKNETFPRVKTGTK